MEEFVVYILSSESIAGKIYIGFTSDLVNRMRSHNLLSNKGHTTRYRPWSVIHIEFFSSKSEAMKREKFFKSGVGRAYIHNNML